MTDDKKVCPDCGTLNDTNAVKCWVCDYDFIKKCL